MSILSTEQIGHVYHDKWLFKQLSFGIHRHERVALVGKNGAGKSTLLKILAGREVAKEGKVIYETGLSVGYLQQDIDFTGFNTISDFIFKSNSEQQRLIRRYDELLGDPSAAPEDIADITQQLTDLDAWEYEYQLKAILQRFGILRLTARIADLSGGQKRRLALAELLINDPELLILDEPTNHLDIETIEWLENLLVNKRKTVIFVSHDRYFLDNICTTIKELDNQNLYSYSGKYEHFLQKKSEREAANSATFEKNKNLLRRELEWMRRQPKARGTKSKARQDSFYALKEKTENQVQDSKLKLQFEKSRQGKKILELHDISKSFGTHTIFADFSYVFKKGDRIGLAGKNGTGKTTFLNLLSGEIVPDTGQIIIGETTSIGYYKQSGLTYNEGERVIDSLKNVAEYIPMSNGDLLSASQLLAQFLFTPERQYGLVSKLSGGERKRLQLLHVLIKNPNFLILDEPSNDLDIDTLNVLEDFLEHYTGVLILVSHDRFLIDKLTDQLFVFSEQPTITLYNGNYTDFKLEESIKKEHVKKIEAAPPEKERKVKKGRTFKEENEFNVLEATIISIEEEINQKTDEMSQSENHGRLKEIAEEIAELNQKLEEKSNRWLELSEL